MKHGYIGEFEQIDDHRAGKIVVNLTGRLNKCGVVSPRFDVSIRDMEKWTTNLLPPRCFLLASSWSIIPLEVVMTTKPNCLEGRRLVVHFSISRMDTSNLGLTTPHLFNRPVRLTTIFPARWSSICSNSPM